MQKRVAFFKEAIKNIKTSGSVMPSSKFLIQKMLQEIDFTKDLILVEFGPANGIITSEILKRMTKKSKLICFEINPVFYQQLVTDFNDDRLIVLNKSAENIAEEMTRLGHKSIDFCISSLPLAMIPEDVSRAIIKNTKTFLKNDGGFVQYQYSLQFHKKIKSIFHKENTNIKFVLLNFPPAFVYYCKKK